MMKILEKNYINMKFYMSYIKWAIYNFTWAMKYYHRIIINSIYEERILGLNYKYKNFEDKPSSLNKEEKIDLLKKHFAPYDFVYGSNYDSLIEKQRLLNKKYE